jgi:hypothetical protein
MVMIVALAVDTGYMMVVRTELQAASDAAAIAAAAKLDQSNSVAVDEAQRFAGFHRVNGKPFVLNPGDVEIGEWDFETQQFIPTGLGNAVRIHAAVNDGTLFFGKLTGAQTFSTTTTSTAGISAVALAAPREILFVVDTSGLMNDDDELASILGGLRGFDGQVGRYVGGNPLNLELENRDWVTTLYDELGWGAAPGTTEIIGQALGVTDSQGAYEELVGTTGGDEGGSEGLLGNWTIPSEYRIQSSDNDAMRRDKAYHWIIDQQLPALMPNVEPGYADFNHWAAYLDYVIQEQSSTSGAQTYHPYDMTDYSNDPSATSLLANRVGYPSYLQFLLDVGAEDSIAGAKSILSLEHPLCPKHIESTDAGPYEFPPSVEPETTVRRTLIDVIHYVDQLNANISSQNRDRVGVIAYSRSSPPQVIVPLTDIYTDAKDQIATAFGLHAQADRGTTSNAEAGLSEARVMLQPQNEGGQGRQRATRMVFYISGSSPDCIATSEANITGYMASAPDANFYYSSEMLNRDGALAEVAQMKLKRWKVKPAGLGLGIDEDFLTRMARIQAVPAQTVEFAGQTPPEYRAALKGLLIGSLKRDVSLVE